MQQSHQVRPGGGAWAAAVVWACLPLFTCGLATPFTIGFAAFWLRSIWQVFAASAYLVCIGSFVISALAYDTFEDIPQPLATLVSLGLFVSWLGGAIHSGFLVPVMARARLRAPMHPPHTNLHQRTTAPSHHRGHGEPGPYQRRPGPAETHRPRPTSGETHRPRPASAETYQRRTDSAETHPPRSGPGENYRRRTTEPAARPRRPGEPEWIGHYRVLQSLGRGGQGAVYLAMAPNGTRVAVKVLHDLVDEMARARFAREVDAARRVATFSTARVLDVNISGQHAYIVSEYVEGPSLEQLVKKHGPRDEDSLTRLALSTAGALAAIHKAGIVHRDFKPSNVLIGNDGPRVIDFGIARALDQVTMTSGKMVGTPPYMSPEQLTGEAVGPASDVFSWAVTIMYAATGRPAFGEDTVPAVFNRVLTLHPDLSPLPPALRGVVGSCLNKRPEDRPSASDVMLAIVH
ncbi:serine/threonine-protein kinase [Nonomuraea jabiensis]|uniref:Putative Ser/Thr protein kinase n=1 Tax=Nonomuraea jabiensis TaxID=882448 RepID=A0A7W9G3M9_9ACTN|nr:serine/threonine-protein kinase [Nonomuraea jabiensis]MBB5776566.1 putative Ser/Thr protein kinase [Nonomuraea jabiensis]